MRSKLKLSAGKHFWARNKFSDAQLGFQIYQIQQIHRIQQIHQAVQSGIVLRHSFQIKSYFTTLCSSWRLILLSAARASLTSGSMLLMKRAITISGMPSYNWTNI